jgi:hypothetical protein
MLSIDLSSRVGEATLFVRSCKLYAIAFAQGTLSLAVHRHALQTARVIHEPLSILALDSQPIVLAVGAFDSGVFTGADAYSLASFRVPHYVAGFILRGHATDMQYQKNPIKWTCYVCAHLS